MQGIDLGDVTFGLNADTAGLERSLSKLRAFSDVVNTTAKSAEDGSAKTSAALARQERLIASSYQKVVDLNRALRETGAPARQIADLTTTFRSVTNELTKGEVSAIEYGRAQSQVTARLNESRRALADWAAENQRVAAMSKAWHAAYAEDAKRTKAINVTRQSIGNAQAAATIIDESRTQTLGKAQAAASIYDELRTRKIATAQMRAQMEDAARSTGKWQEAFTNLGRAAVLVEGPLNGIGARISILNSLFESSAMKTALVVVGITGVATAYGLAAAAAVRATIQFQQWEAAMISASGSKTLVAEDMKYITEQSQKFGLALNATIPAWTSFATSARLSGIAISDQKKIFEAFMTSGSALHWGVDEVRRAFLALEQIISKGKPQMQEVRLQLGQVLPGAFALAAQGMKMTQAELSKAMEQGKIDAKDFVLALSEVTEKAYRAASVQGRTTITSDIQRFNTETLLMAQAFDKASGSSTLFHGGLRLLNELISTVSKNMAGLMNIVIAIIPAITMIFAPTIVAGVVALAGAIRGATVAMIAFGAATAANPIGLVATVLLRLAAAAGVGAVAYSYLNKEQREGAINAKEYAYAMKATVDGLVDIGQVNDKVKERMLTKNNEILAGLNKEIAKVQELSKTYETQAGSMGTRQRMKALGDINGSTARLNDLNQQKAQIEADAKRLNALKVVSAEIPVAVVTEKETAGQRRVRQFLEDVKIQMDYINEKGSKYATLMSRAEKLVSRTTPAEMRKEGFTATSFMDAVREFAAPLKALEAQEEAEKAAARAADLLAQAVTNASEANIRFGLSADQANRDMNQEIVTLGMSVRQKEQATAAWEAQKQEFRAYRFALLITDEAKRASALSDLELQKHKRDQLLLSIQERQVAERQFSIGGMNAINQYIDVSTNAAAQTQKVFTNAFRSIGDALATFVSTGKLDFKSLADSIIADIIRVQVEMALGNMLQSMTGDGKGKGFLDGVASFMNPNMMDGYTTQPHQSKAGSIISMITDIGSMFMGGGKGGGFSKASSNMASGGTQMFAATKPSYLTLPTNFADGGIMTSRGSLPLRSYASGGIADSPQYAEFGEGSMNEAFVPLPDGRSIPVSMRNKGGGTERAITIINNFTLSSPVDRRTQEQIATTAGLAVKRAIARNS